MLRVSPTVLNGLEPLLNARGTTVADVTLAMGLARNIFEDQGQGIDAQSYNDLLEYVAVHFNQRYLGVELGEIQGSSVVGSLWFLLRNSANIDQYINTLIDNFAIFTSAAYFSSERTAQGKVISYNAHPQMRGPTTQAVEAGLTGCSFELRRYLAPDWRPTAVYFKADKPQDLSILNRVFGHNLHFNQSVDAILITHSELKLPLRDSEQQSNSLEISRLNRQSQQNKNTLLIQTENIINASLTKHKCSLAFVAKCLHVKPRTLQYHLSLSSTSFKIIFQDAQLTTALRYLKHSHLSITEIAHRLQFSQVSVFTRFIKTNTGKTPKQLR